MVPFNLFSTFGLVAALIGASVAALFYLRYFFLGCHRVELIFAHYVTASSIACVMLFLGDNVVPEGLLARYTLLGAERSLFYCRMAYVTAILGLTLQVHFVEVYVHGEGASKWVIATVYGVGTLLVASVWSDAFLTPRLTPAGAYSAWNMAVPFWPEAGALATGPLIAEMLVGIYCLWLLWRFHPQPGRVGFKCVRAVRVAMVLTVAGAVVDMTMGVIDWMGISLFPFFSAGVHLTIAGALLRERMQTDRLQQQLESELTLAAKIQKGLLTQQEPGVPGFEVAAWSEPASMVGGDTYDIFPLPEGRFLILLADASGHGLAAAMVIAQARAYLRAVAVDESDPSRIFDRVRQLLGPELNEVQFVTCFMGILDPASGTLTYAAAGQAPFFFYDSAEDRFEREAATEPPLMSLEEMEPPVTRVRQLEQGDLFVISSDGLWEACDRCGGQFGIDRLQQLLEARRRQEARAISDSARTALGEYLGPAPLEDDVTVIVLRRAVSVADGMSPQQGHTQPQCIVEPDPGDRGGVPAEIRFPGDRSGAAVAPGFGEARGRRRRRALQPAGRSGR